MGMPASSWYARVRKWIVRLAVAVVLLLPLVMVGVWLGIQHIPEWYRPPVISPQDYQKVRDDFEAIFNEMSRGLISSREPFKLVLSDEQVNNWMAVRGEILPEASAWVPDYLDDPMIRFEEDLITVGGTVSRGNVRSVVSLGWRVKVRPEIVTLRLEKTRSGSLPVPETAIAELLSKMAGDPATAGASLSQDGMRLAGAIRQAGTGLEIENLFRWSNGDRLFRITSIESKDGSMRLGIQPLNQNR